MGRRLFTAGAASFFAARLGNAAVVPADSDAFTYVGRFQTLADGTKAFDWEGSSIYFSTANATYVKMLMNSTGPTGRFIVEVTESGSPFQATNVWVGPEASDTGVYLLGGRLVTPDDIQWRIFLDNEPSFAGAGPEQYFQFVGIDTDGVLLPPPTFTRKIEIVGDSITVGYGSLGGGPCKVTEYSSSHWADYSQQLCRNFTAACQVVAWSGKGMYENCCDSGETMPSYYLQTRGGNAYVADWNFSAFVPDAMLINLGTNDWNHANEPGFAAKFTATYVQFVLNATRTHYNAPQLPVFVAQGPMNDGQPLTDALQAAITQINAAGGNAHFLDMRGPPNDGCGGHPGLKGHAGMLAMAQPQIAAVMGW